MMSSTASCRRCARFTAALRKDETESVAVIMWTASRPATMEGNATPTMSARIATTTIISISVTPRRDRPLFFFPTCDVGILPFTTGLPIGAVAHDVRLVASVLAGKAIDILVAPGIFRDLRHVRPVPQFD